MIEMQARVIAVEDSMALVEPMSGGSCSSCNSSSSLTSGGGCGADKIGQIFTIKTKNYRVINAISSRIGDEVIIGIEDGAVLRGSAVVYMLPLILIFIGAITAHYLMPNINADLASIIGAASGFAVSALWLFHFNQQASLNPHYQPVILRKAHAGTFILKEVKR
jgi:sigma-E factor negative regulatory protein RseC